MKSLMLRSLLFVLLLAAPAIAQPLADRVPADALFYVGWNGTVQMPAGYENTHLKAVLDSSKIREFVTEFLPQAINKLAQNAGGGPSPALLNSTRMLLTQFWSRPTALVFAGLNMSNPGRPMPRLALICQAGDDAPAMVQQIQALLLLAGGAPVQVQNVGGTVVMSIGYAQPAEALASANGALSQSPGFASALRQVQASPMLICYADVEKTLAAVESIVATTNNPRVQTMMPRVIDALGLRGLRRYIHTSGFDGRDWMSQTFIEMPSPRAGLLQMMDTKPVSPDLLKAIPGDATFAASLRFDAAKFVTLIREAVGKVEPQAQVMFDQGLGAVQIALARNLVTDILEPMGPDWGMYCSPSVAGNGVLGIVAVNRLDDPAKAQMSLPMAAVNLNNWASVALRRFGAPMEIAGRSTLIGGQRIYYIGSPIIAPAWTTKDGNLYLGLFPQSASAAARWNSRGQKSLAENEKFIALQRRLGVVNPISFSYYDLATTAMQSSMYQQLMVLCRYAGMGDLFGVPLPEPFLPPLDVLAEHLGPAGSFAWVDDAGYHVKSISPFLGSKMFSESGMLSSAGIGGTALGVSILLPSLSRARETANRVKCATNLKAMGMGVIVYANENGGRLPQSFGDLLRARGVNVEVFLCPSAYTSLPEPVRQGGIDAQIAWVEADSDYVYLGRGKTMAMMGERDILIYEKPDNHDQEGINILFGDGHVEFVLMEEASQMIQRQAPAGAR